MRVASLTLGNPTGQEVITMRTQRSAAELITWIFRPVWGEKGMGRGRESERERERERSTRNVLLGRGKDMSWRSTCGAVRNPGGVEAWKRCRRRTRIELGIEK